MQRAVLVLVRLNKRAIPSKHFGVGNAQRLKAWNSTTVVGLSGSMSWSIFQRPWVVRFHGAGLPVAPPKSQLS